MPAPADAEPFAPVGAGIFRQRQFDRPPDAALLVKADRIAARP